MTFRRLTGVSVDRVLRREEESPIFRVTLTNPDTRVERRPEREHAVNIAMMQEENRIES